MRTAPNPEQALTRRIRELRRRHFGPRGQAEFARRLGVAPDEYAHYERGTIPTGDILVRICELTGEDLQWLLTGVAARGTVVITGARSRHQELLARLARALDERPALAAPVEAFLDLLLCGAPAKTQAAQVLPAPTPRQLIPILDASDLPLALADVQENEADQGFLLAPCLPEVAVQARAPARLTEPSTDYTGAAPRPVEVLTLAASEGGVRQYVYDPELPACFPRIFAVRVPDDSMRPMFAAGDAVLVAVGSGPKIGRAALCRLAAGGGARCRIWLGEDEAGLHLGRLADGELERVERAVVCWSLEVLYRLAAA